MNWLGDKGLWHVLRAAISHGYAWNLGWHEWVLEIAWIIRVCSFAYTMYVYAQTQVWFFVCILLCVYISPSSYLYVHLCIHAVIHGCMYPCMAAFRFASISIYGGVWNVHPRQMIICLLVSSKNSVIACTPCCVHAPVTCTSSAKPYLRQQGNCPLLQTCYISPQIIVSIIIPTIKMS